MQFSSVHSHDWVIGGGEGMTDDSAEILLQYFMQEAIVSSSGMGRDVCSLMLSIQHFLCQPQCHPSSMVAWQMVLERLRVAKRGPHGRHLLAAWWLCSLQQHTYRSQSGVLQGGGQSFLIQASTDPVCCFFALLPSCPFSGLRESLVAPITSQVS